MDTVLTPVPRIPLRTPADRADRPGPPGPVLIPQVGFGLYKVAPEQIEAAVGCALAAGYRHLDTASLYANEAALGEMLQGCGTPRDEIFLTTKVWNDAAQSPAGIRAALTESLRRLRTDYLDLYLIHWPVPAADRYVQAWQTLRELRDAGLVRAIGVSNFQPDHLRRLVAETGEAPAVNQIELHPHLQQPALQAVHQELGIVTQAWSPLKRADVFAEPVIEAIAAKHSRTPAQVVLRWHTQLGRVVIPKSVTPERIVANLAIYDFELDGDDLVAIGALDRGERTGPDPDLFHFGVEV